MTQNEKDLLLKDLSSRLQYGVKISITTWNEDTMEYEDKVDEVYSINKDGYIRTANEDYEFEIEDVKPYLFPLSSMTEDQKDELDKLGWYFDNFGIDNIDDYHDDKEVVTHILCSELVDWLNKNRFDYRGFIPIELANDATGLNIY